MGIEMRKLNHFINKPFANGFSVLKYSKLKSMQSVYFCLYLNNYINFVSLNRDIYYALLKDAF